MIHLENEAGLTAEFDLAATAELVSSTVLQRENCPRECEIELLITDEDTVRQINREYRMIDRTTDVLSFPNIEWDAPADYDCDGFRDELLTDPDNGLLMLGQIVLNASKILSQAEEYGHGVRREYAFLIAHSMLHLLGYDHMTEEEAAEMERRQDQYLNEIGITR